MTRDLSHGGASHPVRYFKNTSVDDYNNHDLRMILNFRVNHYPDLPGLTR